MKHFKHWSTVVLVGIAATWIGIYARSFLQRQHDLSLVGDLNLQKAQALMVSFQQGPKNELSVSVNSAVIEDQGSLSDLQDKSTDNKNVFSTEISKIHQLHNRTNNNKRYSPRQGPFTETPLKFGNDWILHRFKNKRRFVLQKGHGERAIKWVSENQELLLLHLQNRSEKNAPSRAMKSKKRVIYFLHLHKAGGTSLCRLARQNVLITSTKMSNCNVQSDWRCCGNSDTLEAQQRFARDHIPPGFPVFVASEGHMYQGMDINAYFYMVMLRNSRSRYLSHWRYVQHMLFCHSQNVSNATATISVVPGPSTFEPWWKRQPDNFGFRHICGTRCMERPKYQMTRDDVEYTLQRLVTFDCILFLEQWETSMQRLRQSLSWNVDMNMHLNSASRHQKRLKCENTAVDDGSWDPFMSVLDDLIYDVAQVLVSGNDTQSNQNGTGVVVLDRYGNNNILKSFAIAWRTTTPTLEKYFEDGPRRKCTTVCCGHCSQS